MNESSSDHTAIMSLLRYANEKLYLVAKQKVVSKHSKKEVLGEMFACNKIHAKDESGDNGIFMSNSVIVLWEFSFL